MEKTFPGAFSRDPPQGPMHPQAWGEEDLAQVHVTLQKTLFLLPHHSSYTCTFMISSEAPVCGLCPGLVSKKTKLERISF